MSHVTKVFPFATKPRRSFDFKVKFKLNIGSIGKFLFRLGFKPKNIDHVNMRKYFKSSCLLELSRKTSACVSFQPYATLQIFKQFVVVVDLFLMVQNSAFPTLLE